MRSMLSPVRVLIALLGVFLVVLALARPTAPAVALASPFTVPPIGGLTQGVAGSSDPRDVVRAQMFDVETAWVLDPATQRWLVFVPGAPAFLNTLVPGELDPEAVVTVKRRGVSATQGMRRAKPAALPAVSGAPAAFAAPPAGGLVQGRAGTNDPQALVDAQPFEVSALFVLDVGTQRWLTYIPGAPEAVQSLVRGMIEAGSVVTMRRADGAAAGTTGVDRAAEERMLALVNAARAEAGLAPLTLDAEMSAVARAHSADMRDRDYFAHTNPDGLDPFDRMESAGVSFGYAAENIARAPSVERAHQLLMNSDGHRRNILGDRYVRIGIGVVNGGDTGLFFTQVFAD